MKVDCKGSKSIFAALTHCLPELTRHSKKTALDLRNAISEIELNKFLARNGFISHRSRHRIPGTHRWNKGTHRWKDLRWINPKISEDLQTLTSRLLGLANDSSFRCGLHRDSVISFLETVLAGQKSTMYCYSTPGNDDCNYNIPSAFEDAEGFFCRPMADTSDRASKKENAFRPFSHPWEMTYISTPSRCTHFNPPPSSYCRHHRIDGPITLTPSRCGGSLRFTPAAGMAEDVLALPPWLRRMGHHRQQYGNDARSLLSIIR